MTLPTVQVEGVSRKLDYIVSPDDDRDYVFKENASSLPDSAALPTFELPVYRVEDQGIFGACTGFAVTTAFERLVAAVTGDSKFQGSPLFNYTNSRLLDAGNLEDDDGTTLRSACANLRVLGLCRDVTWPYDYLRFPVAPTPEAYAEARQLANVLNYYEIRRTISTFKTVLGAYKLYITVGIMIYPSFMDASVSATGNVPDVDFDNDTPIGGHAVNIYGYDDVRERFKFVNQYGTGWGVAGTGTISYKYIMHMTATPEAKVLLPDSRFAQAYAAASDKVAVSPPSAIAQTKMWKILVLLSVLAAFATLMFFFLLPLGISRHGNRPAVLSGRGRAL
jgi:C1A family cysteine protease